MERTNYEHYLKYIGGVRFWIITTGVIVAFTAMKEASHIVNMILLAAMLTVISLAPLNWLKKKGLNKNLANVVIILSVVVVVGLIGAIIGSSLTSFSERMPLYYEKFHELWGSVINSLIDNGLIDKQSNLMDGVISEKLLPMAAPIATGFGSVVSRGLIVFLFYIFMILESEQFAKKMAFISKKSLGDAGKVVKQLRRYFGIKTLTSLATGIVLSISLYFIGVEFFILWGFLAFILNYIPSIGSLIAALPAVLIAFVMHGTVAGIETVIVYLVFNTIIGNVIEPQLMGKNLGISPLIVFFSMILFGYILGPVGMLIATPLTILVKIILDSRDVTSDLGIMLGDGREVEDYEKKKKINPL